MILLNIIETTLPLTNPILKFFLILVIILFAPIIFNKIKIPHLLGLIIAGAIIGPNGFNLMSRDSSIILSGTAGLLYIMFLAGLDIDLMEFKKNRAKSIQFGFFTFSIPMVLGILTGIYVLNFSITTSVLLASMFASHTLIAYPIISKLGVAKNRAVNITIGGTMITDTLALFVLAIIVGMETGEVNTQFWVRLFVSITIFVLIVVYLFPIISRWFFKRYEDNVSQYIFVLAMVFFGAVLAEMAGIEGIIGAFLTGLTLNRLIPRTSALMNRVEFVGNAIFIPFFLIGVGMLIDYRAFFKDFETIKVAAVMTIVATFAKYAAAWLAQKKFKFSADERRLMFGLSNAQAAATLAAVIIGYNIIVGVSVNGEPIRLLNDSILNGTIIMILITCTIASLVAQKGAQNIALSKMPLIDKNESGIEEKILILVNNPETIEELINLSLLIKSKINISSLHALNIVNIDNKETDADNKAKKMLEKAINTAASADIPLNRILRYDLNIANGISSVVKENKITDLILGLHIKKDISDTYLGNLTNKILSRCNTTTLVYKSAQPVSTIKRHIIIVPEHAENEIGFPFWLIKVWGIARNTGTKLVFYAPENIIQIIKDIQTKHPVKAEFKTFNNWDNFENLTQEIKKDDNLWIILSRKNKPSYHTMMADIPSFLKKYFQQNSCILVYPMQTGVINSENIDFKNPSFVKPIENLDEIGKTFAYLFGRK